MRRFASFAVACTFVALAGFASAQQIDLAAGGNTLWSSKSNTASQAFTPPPEKGGLYPSASVQYVLDNHFGINAEGTFRYYSGLYNGYQRYRPVLYDVNAVFAPVLARKTTGNFMAGIGAESILFYNEFTTCSPNSVNCRVYQSNTHFLLHFGAGVRYSIWHGIFVRPEVHWYFIPNNFEFHSDNVFRLGASVGYTFGSR